MATRRHLPRVRGICECRGELVRLAPAIFVVAAIAALVALHVVWLDRFRFSYVTEWDESGYISIALRDSDALRSGGPMEFFSVILKEEVQAPLVPASAAPLHLLLGAGINSSLLIEPAFFALLMLSTYGVGRQLMTPWWAALAAICVATAPVVADFTRLFHFSVPAAALLTAAMYALLKSDGLARRGWAIGCGLLLGLTVLARTMTIAYLPGFALAAGLLLILRPSDRKRGTLNFALLCAAGGALAALWYGPNLRSVGSYLLNFGYGAESSAYGAERSPFSVGFWTSELEGVVDDLYLPLSAVLAACLVAGATSSLAHRGRFDPSWKWIRARLDTNAAVILVIVLEGYVALSSSSNQGTAFSLPLLPALVVLVVAAAARVRWQRVRWLLVSLLAGVSLFNLTMKSGLVPEAAEPASVVLPALGRTPVVDGRGLIQKEVAGAGYVTGEPTDPMPDLQRRWLPFAESLAVWMTEYAERHGQRPFVAWGFDDLLLSNTRIALASELALSRRLPTRYLKPFPEGDTVSSYRTQLRDANLLVTGERGPGRPDIRLTRRRVEAAARSVGFERVRRFTLPDGRQLSVWWRGVEPPDDLFY